MGDQRQKLRTPQATYSPRGEQPSLSSIGRFCDSTYKGKVPVVAKKNRPQSAHVVMVGGVSSGSSRQVGPLPWLRDDRRPEPTPIYTKTPRPSPPPDRQLDSRVDSTHPVITATAEISEVSFTPSPSRSDRAPNHQSEDGPATPVPSPPPGEPRMLIKSISPRRSAVRTKQTQELESVPGTRARYKRPATARASLSHKPHRSPRNSIRSNSFKHRQLTLQGASKGVPNKAPPKRVKPQSATPRSSRKPRSPFSASPVRSFAEWKSCREESSLANSAAESIPAKLSLAPVRPLLRFKYSWGVVPPPE